MHQLIPILLLPLLSVAVSSAHDGETAKERKAAAVPTSRPNKAAGSAPFRATLENGVVFWCVRTERDPVRLTVTLASGPRWTDRKTPLPLLHAAAILRRLNRPRHAVRSPRPVGGTSWELKPDREWMTFETITTADQTTAIISLLARLGPAEWLKDGAPKSLFRRVFGSAEGRRPDPPDLRLERAVFKGHPLGRPISPMLGAKKKPDLASLQSFHQRNFVGRRLRILLSGPLPCSELVSKVRASLGSLNAGRPPDPKKSPPSRSPRLPAVGAVFVSRFTAPSTTDFFRADTVFAAAKNEAMRAVAKRWGMTVSLRHHRRFYSDNGYFAILMPGARRISSATSKAVANAVGLLLMSPYPPSLSARLDVLLTRRRLLHAAALRSPEQRHRLLLRRLASSVAVPSPPRATLPEKATHKEIRALARRLLAGNTWRRGVSPGYTPSRMLLLIVGVVVTALVFNLLWRRLRRDDED